MFRSRTPPVLAADVSHCSEGLQGLNDASVFYVIRQPQKSHFDVTGVWVNYEVPLAFHKLSTLTQLRLRERVRARDYPNVTHLELPSCRHIAEVNSLFDGVSKFRGRVRPSAQVGVEKKRNSISSCRLENVEQLPCIVRSTVARRYGEYSASGRCAVFSREHVRRGRFERRLLSNSELRSQLLT